MSKVKKESSSKKMKLLTPKDFVELEVCLSLEEGSHVDIKQIATKWFRVNFYKTVERPDSVIKLKNLYCSQVLEVMGDKSDEYILVDRTR